MRSPNFRGQNHRPTGGIRISPFNSPGTRFHPQPQQVVAPVPWTAVKLIARQSLIPVAIKGGRVYKLPSSFFIHLTASNPFYSVSLSLSSFVFLYSFLFSLQLCSFPEQEKYFCLTFSLWQMYLPCCSEPRFSYAFFTLSFLWVSSPHPFFSNLDFLIPKLSIFFNLSSSKSALLIPTLSNNSILLLYIRWWKKKPISWRS